VLLTTSGPISLSSSDKKLIALATLLAGFVFLLLSVAGISRYRVSQQRNAMRAKLYKERERAQVTLKSIGDAVIATDVEQTITFINPMAEKLLQTSLQHSVGKPVDEVVLLKEMPSGFQILEPINHFTEITEMRLKQTGVETSLCVKGDLVSVDVTVSQLLDEDSEVIGWVMVLRDVSLERELTNELVYQASHDTLTGLVNRSEFENKLKEALESSRQQDTQHALLYMDMDEFKLVNDTCGHIAGDDLLKQVAKLLNLQMRERDLVARLGGDEFGVLLFYCGQNKAKEVAERIRQSLNDFHFSWEDKLFDISASIGLVMINRDSVSLTDLLSYADLACYAAKDAGRNIVHCYDADDEGIAKNFSQMQWLPRIKDALLNDEFTLAVQPIVSLRAEQSPQTIYEFLLRWPQSDGSFISPALFIPSAERYDLMRAIDRWVIRNALHAIPHIVKKLKPQGEVIFTINLSGQSVGDPELQSFILQMFESSGVDTILVCFEVTETVAIANFSTANDFITQLRARGCRFALDDFGSGLSSFGYLKSLPLDFLKIDGLFIRDMMKDEVDTAMVRTINDIAKVLKLQTIAEWVENAEVADTLREMGVDYAQGYHFESPTMVTEIID
jgi:diguanylate cyclase (GGDEF)-like protein